MGSKAAGSTRFPGFCVEKMRLLHAYTQALRSMSQVISDQLEAVVAEDPDFSRFDELVHMAGQSKEQAKYAYILHVKEHGCHEGV